jgi:hypothetical protein
LGGAIKMGKLSEEDKAQLEYIYKWNKMKEERKKEKQHRRSTRKFHFLRAKWYLKNAFEDLKLGLFI